MTYRVIEEGEEGHDKIKITNRDDTFCYTELTTDPEQGLLKDGDCASYDNWVNYFICGYKAILSCNETLKSLVTKPKGL
jgi:hypothetical protein